MNDDDLTRLLGQLRALQRRQRRERPPVEGLSRSAVRVLGAVARSDGGAQPTQIAAELVMTSSNVAAALRELMREGLVSRLADEADTRRVNITLTATGDRVVADARTTRDMWLVEAMRDLLTDQDEAVLVAAGAILERVAGYHPNPSATQHSPQSSSL
jgi:DNA-binding MarR family transcriptional regulator